MLTDQEIFDRVLASAKEAQVIRNKVDEIWTKGLVSVEKINVLYIRRQTELLNCFQSFLSLLTSKNLWQNSGLSEWATIKKVDGPLSSESQGDNIDKLIDIFERLPNQVIAIIGLHEKEKDRIWMTDDINMIRNTISTNKSLLEKINAQL